MGKGLVWEDEFQVAGEWYDPMDHKGLQKSVNSYRSIFDLFSRAVDSYDEQTAISYRDRENSWVDMNYLSLMLEVIQLSDALISLNVGKSEGVSEPRIAVSAQNGREFYETEFALNAIGGSLVTIFPNSTPQEYSYILSDSKAGAILAGQNQVEMLISRQDEYKNLRSVIVKGGSGIAETLSGIKIIGYDELLRSGQPNDDRYDLLSNNGKGDLDDIANIIYSSGTTGAQKGVMLSNRNQISNIFQAQERLRIPSGLKHLSLLPLHHSYAMMCDMLVPMACGSHVYFTDKEHFKDDLRELPVDVMCAVPLLQEKVLSGVKTKLDSSLIGRALKHLVFDRSEGYVHNTAAKILKGKIVNPNFEYFINGGGGLPPEIAKELGKIGLTVVGGYGMTESSPVASVNYPDHRNRTMQGASGQPLAGVEMKLLEDGELIMRGPNMMAGYLGKPDATRDTIDSDGFVHTGDLARFDEEGNLYITGRKKETIVLSTGKNINPSQIEAAVAGNMYVNQMFLIGSLNGVSTVDEKYRIDQKVLVALVAPNHSVLPKDITGEKLERFLLNEINSCCKTFSDYERPKSVVLIDEVMPGELMTQTGKVKRKRIVEQYGPQILEAYQDLENKYKGKE